MSEIVDGYYIFDNDFRKIGDALKGNGVISGLAVSERGAGANMSVDVASGVAYVNGVRVEKASTTNVVISSSNPTNPRKDIIVLASDGTPSAVAGTPTSALPVGQTGPNTYEPIPPDIPANQIILGEVWVAAGVTQINNADITQRPVTVMTGVNRLIAGTGVDLSPASGRGEVTITNTLSGSGEPHNPESWLGWVSGSTYYRRDGNTGTTYSGSDAATIANAAINAMS